MKSLPAKSSAALAEPTATSPAIKLTPAVLEHVRLHPSSIVPPEVRDALLDCWLCHITLRGLETSAFPIAKVISTWINKHGLLPDDARAALEFMQKPSSFKHHVHASEMLADLGEQVEKILEMRKAEAERAERAKAAAEEAIRAKTDSKEVVRLLSERGLSKPEDLADSMAHGKQLSDEEAERQNEDNRRRNEAFIRGQR